MKGVNKFGIIIVFCFSLLFITGCAEKPTPVAIPTLTPTPVLTQIIGVLKKADTGMPLYKMPDLQFLCETGDNSENSQLFSYDSTYDSETGNFVININFLTDQKNIDMCFVTTVGCNQYNFDNALNISKVGTIQFGKTTDMGEFSVEYCN